MTTIIVQNEQDHSWEAELIGTVPNPHLEGHEIALVVYESTSEYAPERPYWTAEKMPIRKTDGRCRRRD